MRRPAMRRSRRTTLRSRHDHCLTCLETRVSPERPSLPAPDSRAGSAQDGGRPGVWLRSPGVLHLLAQRPLAFTGGKGPDGYRRRLLPPLSLTRSLERPAHVSLRPTVAMTSLAFYPAGSPLPPSSRAHPAYELQGTFESSEAGDGYYGSQVASFGWYGSACRR